MKPWEIVAQEDKAVSEGSQRLILLRGPYLMDPYKIYGLVKQAGTWLLVDRFAVPGTTGTESPDWAFRHAWPLFHARGMKSSQVRP
ncbi:MAG TPA: hypothetical protein VK859_12090 [bacterium]|jgi:hypothetical protein|nr:hypothetical protein [bacterium]